MSWEYLWAVITTAGATAALLHYLVGQPASRAGKAGDRPSPLTVKVAVDRTEYLRLMREIRDLLRAAEGPAPSGRFPVLKGRPASELEAEVGIPSDTRVLVWCEETADRPFVRSKAEIVALYGDAYLWAVLPRLERL